MISRILVVFVLATLAVSLTSALVSGQDRPAARDTWTPPPTPWGHPDLQGTWTNSNLTPLQRPADVAQQEVLTDEEWAERNAVARLSDDGPVQGPVGFYNDFWLEQGELSRRTSLIVDPPGGRLPPVTPDERERQRRRRDSYTDSHLAHGTQFDSWHDFNTLDRCITRGMPGAMMPGFYNHNYLILQTPGYVVIALEMLHDVRIIPLDGRPHIDPRVAQWLGDSRGRWEGDTLVVETRNVADTVNEFRVSHTVFGASRHLRLVERFTRAASDRIDYTFTVDDPTTFVEPWTGAAPMFPIDGRMYEYACHEGNYAMEHILRGARAQQQEGQDFNPVAPLTLIRGGTP